MVSLSKVEETCSCGLFSDGDVHVNKLSRKIFCLLVLIVPFGILCGVFALIMGFGHGAAECGPYGPHTDDANPHLGRWHDGPRHQELAYVCEQEAVGGCPETWARFEGSCYKLMCQWISQPAAEKRCKREGAHLVSIRSQAENNFVQKLVGGLSVWIGFSEPPGSEVWRWSDGKNDFKPYTNWDDGEPNNYRGKDEDAAFMNYWESMDMSDPWVQRQRYHGDGPDELKFQMVIWSILAIGTPLIVLASAACCLKQANQNCVCCLCSCSIVSIVVFALDIVFHVFSFFIYPDELLDTGLFHTVLVGCIIVAIIQLVLCAFVCCRSQELNIKFAAMQSPQSMQAQPVAAVVGVPVNDATYDNKPAAGTAASSNAALETA